MTDRQTNRQQVELVIVTCDLTVAIINREISFCFLYLSFLFFLKSPYWFNKVTMIDEVELNVEHMHLP